MSLLINPIHPGEVLSELYLEPLGMSAATLASHLGVPATRIERLVKGRAAISADTAVRLSRFFSTTPQYWANMQQTRDLAQAQEKIDASCVKPLENCLS